MAAGPYVDDFVVLLHGTQDHTAAVHEDVVSVLAPLGLRTSGPARRRGGLVLRRRHAASWSGGTATPSDNQALRFYSTTDTTSIRRASLMQDRQCRVAADEPSVIMLTTFDLDQYVYAALTAGASGFLLKDTSPEYLVAAVRTVRAGDALLAPAITRRLVERFTRRDADAPAIPRDLTALTARELEVLRLLAEGMNNAELADRLHLSEATVKTHVAHILAKLRLRDRVQAVVVAYQTGLVNPTTPE